MSFKSVMVDDFRKGANERQGDIQDEPVNEFRQTQNMQLTGDGRGFKPRGGTKRFDTAGTALPAQTTFDEFANLFYWLQDDIPGATNPTGYLMASVEGDIFAVDVTFADTGTRTSIFAGAAGNVWDFQPAKNAAGTSHLWACNGSDNNQKITTALATSAWTINNGSAQKPKCICYWKGRMVAAGGTIQNSRLIFSAIGDPETWAANDFLDLRDVNDPADQIIDMKVLGEDLIIFRRNSIWRIYDPTGFANQKIHDVGIAAVNQVAEWEGRLYFPTRYGLYSTNGVSLKLESKKLETFNFQLNSDKMRCVITKAGLLYCNQGQSSGLYEFYLTLDDGDGNHPFMSHSVGANGFFVTAMTTSWDGTNRDRLFCAGWTLISSTNTWAIAETLKWSKRDEWDFNLAASANMNAIVTTQPFRLEDASEDLYKRIVKQNIGMSMPSEFTAMGTHSAKVAFILADAEDTNALGGGNVVGATITGDSYLVQTVKTKFVRQAKVFLVAFQFTIDAATPANSLVGQINFFEFLYRGGRQGGK